MMGDAIAAHMVELLDSLGPTEAKNKNAQSASTSAA